MATIRTRNGKYQVLIRRQGSPDQTKTFIQRRDAELWARQKDAEIDRSEYVSLDLLKQPLSVLIQRYLESVTPLKKSAATEAYRVKRLLRDRIAEVPIKLLAQSHLAEFRDRRLADGRRACHHDLVTLRHIIEVARKDWGYPIADNPVTRIQWPAPVRARTRRLLPTEYERLGAASDKSYVWYLWPVINLALETAMRRGEILGLRWDQVDLDRRIAVLKETKNGDDREVPLSLAAVSWIERLPKGKPRLVPVSADALRQSWRRLVDRAGIDDLRFHDLRHEAITRLIEAGLSVPEVALISGHRDIRQLHRYTHLRADNLIKRLDRCLPPGGLN
jgi:integrase